MNRNSNSNDAAHTLLVFQNKELPPALYLNLQSTYKVILLSDHSVQDPVTLYQMENALSLGKSEFHWPISIPKALFLLRDFGFRPLLPKVRFSLLFVGGSVQEVMPQYFIFKRLVGSTGNILFWGETDPDSSLVLLLQAGAADGKQHLFRQVSFGGLSVWCEDVN